MATINGTSGDDNLAGTSGDDNIYGNGGNDTIDGGDGNDTLRGGEGDDALQGGDGNDSLQGGTGADWMEGGNGNDSYFVDDIGDAVVETGDGLDTVISSLANYRLGANVEILKLGGIGVVDPDGFQNGSGNELNNSIQGNAVRNNLYGDAGNDSVFGYGGDDIINGGAGDDVLNGGDGIDLLSYKVGATGGVTVDLSLQGANQNTGSAGIDKASGFENLEGTEFADTLSGDGGANLIKGLGGNDTIRGRGGDDELVGGADADDFLFEAVAANGFDTIRNFESGSDELVFNSSDGYVAGNFSYDNATHRLFYDADGAGGADPVALAQFLGSDAALTDIVII